MSADMAEAAAEVAGYQLERGCQGTPESFVNAGGAMPFLFHICFFKKVSSFCCDMTLY